MQRLGCQPNGKRNATFYTTCSVLCQNNSPVDPILPPLKPIDILAFHYFHLCLGLLRGLFPSGSPTKRKNFSPPSVLHAQIISLIIYDTNFRKMRYLLPTKSYLGNKIKWDETGEECATHGGKNAFTKRRKTDYLLDLGADGSIILNLIFRMQGGGLGWSGSGQELLAGSCESGNEPSCSIKWREFD